MKIYEQVKLIIYQVSENDVVRTSAFDKEDTQDDVFFSA